ncbi:MAG: PilZ domain-containing protein [Vulcanimicrobiota bacterium]
MKTSESEDLQVEATGQAKTARVESMAQSEQPDRRSAERRKSRVNKLVHSKIETDSGEFQSFMYLVDISPGGLRANLDHHLEPNSKLRIRFPLKPYLQDELEADLPCRVVWNRDLVGGTFVHGFEFQDLSPSTRELVERLFVAFSPEGKRQRFRLRHVLNVAYLADQIWVSRVAFDISPEGLGLSMAELPQSDQTFQFRIYLEDRDKFDPVEVSGRVTYLVEIEEEPCRVGIQFIDPDPEAVQRIQKFIDSRAR